MKKCQKCDKSAPYLFKHRHEGVNLKVCEKCAYPNQCRLCKGKVDIPSWKICRKCDQGRLKSPLFTHQKKLEREAKRQQEGLMMLKMYLEGKTQKEIARKCKRGLVTVRGRLKKYPEFIADRINHQRNNPNVFKDKEILLDLKTNVSTI